MLFMVAAMAAEMERDLIRERSLDGLRAAQAQGRRGGLQAAVEDGYAGRRPRSASLRRVRYRLGGSSCAQKPPSGTFWRLRPNHRTNMT